nr:MAG TPA: hypothetical protein [Caudoviricetes sp.]DAQ69170.1 MAG TPA: hypothetical protein [Caudoviricetes sp.]DAW00218.1 MAG TPA: hypothetical protein [Caudoviricetes sp.]
MTTLDYYFLQLILLCKFLYTHGRTDLFGIPLLTSYKLPAHRHQGSALQCNSLLRQR